MMQKHTLFLLPDTGEQDYQQALSYLAKDNAKAYRYLIQAAEHGHINAHFELGNAYLYGIVMQQNFAKACHYFKTAAKKGHKDAAYNLGIMCLYGLGIEADKQLAHYYFRVSHKLPPTLTLTLNDLLTNIHQNKLMADQIELENQALSALLSLKK